METKRFIVKFSDGVSNKVHALNIIAALQFSSGCIGNGIKVVSIEEDLTEPEKENNCIGVVIESLEKIILELKNKIK